MRSYRVSHHVPSQLRRGLFLFNKRTNRDTAMMLAFLGEFDDQKLYRPEAYPSMHQFCVSELGMSEDAADKRIRVARITREFPALFPAIAEGRLHLSGVLLLAPVLTRENAENLVHAASRKGCAQIREMLATWFPKPEPPAQAVMDARTNAVACNVNSPALARVEELSGTPNSLAIPSEMPRPKSFIRLTCELGLNRVPDGAGEGDELGLNRVPPGAKRSDLRGLLAPEVQALLDRAHEGSRTPSATRTRRRSSSAP